MGMKHSDLFVFLTKNVMYIVFTLLYLDINYSNRKNTVIYFVQHFYLNFGLKHLTFLFKYQYLFVYFLTSPPLLLDLLHFNDVRFFFLLDFRDVCRNETEDKLSAHFFPGRK